MRKILLSCTAVLFTAVFFSSCARGISPYEAANGKAKCGRYIK